MTRAIQLDGAIEPEPYTDPSTGYNPDDPAIKAAFEEGRRKAREELQASLPYTSGHAVAGWVQPPPSGSPQVTVITTSGGTVNTSAYLHPLTGGSGYWSTSGNYATLQVQDQSANGYYQSANGYSTGGY